MDTEALQNNISISSPGFIIVKQFYTAGATTTTTSSSRPVFTAHTTYSADGSPSTDISPTSVSAATVVTTTYTVTPDSATTSTPDPQNSEPNENAGLSTGARAGIAVGVVLAAIALLAFYCIYWRRRRSRSSTPTLSKISSPAAHELGSRPLRTVPDHPNAPPEMREVIGNAVGELDPTSREVARLQHNGSHQLQPPPSVPAELGGTQRQRHLGPVALTLAELGGNPSAIRPPSPAVAGIASNMSAQQPSTPIAEMGENSQVGLGQREEMPPSYQDVWVKTS
jgi:hypothetical protein